MLECSLIKQHSPKYNILLKDDKGYHYVKITQGPWPRITSEKQIVQDGANYLGPYVSSWTVKQAVGEANKIFKLPTCSRKFPQEFGKGPPLPEFLYRPVLRPLPGKAFREGIRGVCLPGH